MVEGEVQSPDLVVLPIVEDMLVLVCGQEHAFYTEKMLSKEALYYQKFARREPEVERDSSLKNTERYSNSD